MNPICNTKSQQLLELIACSVTLFSEKWPYYSKVGLLLKIYRTESICNEREAQG